MVASKYATKYINKYNTTEKERKEEEKTRSYANVWLSADTVVRRTVLFQKFISTKGNRLF